MHVTVPSEVRPVLRERIGDTARVQRRGGGPGLQARL